MDRDGLTDLFDQSTPALGIVVRYWRHNGADHPIRFRSIDGAVNATDMGKAAGGRGKDWAHYRRNQKTDALIAGVAAELQICIDDVVQSSPAPGHGTWIHRWIAIDYARWLDLEFRLWILKTIDQILSKASMTFANRSEEREHLLQRLKRMNLTMADDFMPQVKRWLSDVPDLTSGALIETDLWDDVDAANDLRLLKPDGTLGSGGRIAARVRGSDAQSYAAAGDVTVRFTEWPKFKGPGRSVDTFFYGIVANEENPQAGFSHAVCLDVIRMGDLTARPVMHKGLYGFYVLNTCEKGIKGLILKSTNWPQPPAPPRFEAPPQWWHR